MADIEDSLRDNAASPKRAKTDGVEMEQHSLPDQIAADRYLEGKKAARSKGFGVALKKLVPPGTD